MLPVNCSIQQDAQEFLQVLCDRLEHAHSAGRYQPMPMPLGDAGDGEARPAPAVSAVGELLRRSFGGKLCSQLLRHGDGAADDAGGSGVREQDTPFVCLSLEVRRRALPEGVRSSASPAENSCPHPHSYLPFDQVKDARGLEDSLAKFVKGEHISDYQVTDFSPPPPLTTSDTSSH